MFDLYVLIILAIIIVIEFLWIKLRAEKEVYGNLPPGTMGWPVIGETMEFAKKKIAFFVEKHQKYGRVFKTHMLGKPVIRVYGSDNIRKIITGENKIVQSNYPASVRKLIGDESVSMCHGDAHKTKKRHLMKYLSPEFINNHIPIFAETISKRMKQWCMVTEIELFTECKKLFVELAAKYLVKIDISDEEVSEIMKQHEIFSKNLFCLPVYFPGFGFYKAYNAKLRMREIFANCINHNKDVNGNLCSVLEEYRTSCSDNIDAKTDEEFLDAIVELLFFGAETISSAGFSIIYNLTKEGQSLEKLRQDIQDKGLLDVTDDVYSPHDLQQMTFANAVVKETLRMLPPVGGAYRKVIQTFQLEGYTIPKGWSVAFGIRDTHHNDGTVDQQRKFNPERWLAPGFEKERYTYIPFGGGSRICPGKMYAQTLLKIFTVEFGKLCRTEMIKDSGLDLWPVPRPKNEIIISVSSNKQ